MKIRQEHLQRAEREGALPPGGAASLWGNLSGQLAEEPAFKAQHLLYYFGALLMLLPFTLFASAGLLRLGDAGLLAIALAVGTGTYVAASRLLAARRRIAAGVFATVSLCLVPLGVYSLLALCGVDLATPYLSSGYRDFHRVINAKFVIVEVLTLLAAAAYLYRFRLPFLMLPVAVTAWYLGMDLSSRIAGESYGSTFQAWSLAYGLVLMGCAYVVERRTRHVLADFSFWPWIFGTLSFWSALSSMDSGSAWGKHLYALVCLGMVVASVAVGRRVLAVAGALGLTGYLGHLSLAVFSDALAFPFVTLVLGAALVGAGLHWPRIEAKIAARLGLPNNSGQAA
jgi:hypothetical protein